MYAVIKTGGKQYRVAPGDTIRIERVSGDIGEAVTFGSVLAVHTEDKKVLSGVARFQGQSYRQDRAAGPLQESYRLEVQEDQSVQDFSRPPPELHRGAGQRYLAVIRRKPIQIGL